MPTAEGAGDGTNWANAAPLMKIDAMVAAVGAGGTVYLRADAGSYVFKADPASIAHGGASRNPVTIMGVDASLTPKKAVLIGNRNAWTLPSDPEQVTNVSSWSGGPTVFLLAKGADHLTFRFLDFQHAGHPIYMKGPVHTGITVEDCSAYNFRRFFEHEAGTAHVGTILRRISGIGFSKTAIRIRGDSHDVLLEDVTLDSGRQDGDNFATGVELNDTAHDVTMIRVTVKNCHDTRGNNPGGFWNADGFASERGNYNINRIECVSSGHTDAGFDDKGRNVKHIRCTASGNKVNYKFWGPNHVNEDCKALNPRKRGGTTPQTQYWLAGTGKSLNVPGRAGDLVIRGGEISDDDRQTVVLMAEGSGAQIRSIGVTLRKNPSAIRELEQGAGNIFLYGSPSDRTPPVVTSASAITALADVPQAHLLGADEPVSWSIADGPDAAAFSLVQDRTTATLRVIPIASGAKKVVVRARDASDNVADQTVVVTVGPAATTFFAEDFNRPDQDLRSKPGWVCLDPHDAPKDIGIRDQKLAIFHTDFNGILYASPDHGFPDHYVQAKVASVPRETGGALCARASNGWNLIAVRFGAEGVRLMSRREGNWKPLAPAAGAPAAGDVLRLEVKGGTATVRKNGTIIIGPVATGGAGDGATRQGVLASDAVVNPWIDDYEAGPL